MYLVSRQLAVGLSVFGLRLDTSGRNTVSSLKDIEKRIQWLEEQNP